MRAASQLLTLCVLTLMPSPQSGAGESVHLATDGRALATLVPGDTAGVDWPYVVGIVRDRLRARCGVQLPVADSTAAARIVLRIDPRLESSAYAVQTRGSGVRVRGGSLVALLHGAGRWLRSVRMAPGQAVAPPLDIQAAPYADLVCMYTPPHFHNSYEKGPLEDVRDAYEEMALWGTNAVCVWADPYEVGDPFAPGAVDDEGRAFWERCATLLGMAQRLGCRTGLVITPNVVYADQLADTGLLATPGPGTFGPILCPSVPEAREVCLRNQENALRDLAQRGIELDFICPAPYDFGGCACAACKPYYQTFLGLMGDLATILHRHHPRGKVHTCTWWVKGAEQQMLQDFMAKAPEWFEAVSYSLGYTRVLPAQSVPGSVLKSTFLHVSYDPYDRYGKMGATVDPVRVGGLVAGFPAAGIKGVMCYIEGRYSSLNEVVAARTAHEPDGDLDTVLREYAAWYFGADGVGQALFCRAVRDIGAAEAHELLGQLEARLNSRGRESWRFRQVLIKANVLRIQRELGGDWSGRLNRVLARARTDDVEAVRTEALAFIERIRSLDAERSAELTRLKRDVYKVVHQKHCLGFDTRPQAEDWGRRAAVRVREFPRPGDLATLSRGCPVAASSTAPDFKGSERMLTDGVLAQDDPQNFWVHDVAKGESAWLTVDLGAARMVGQVRLQFREIHGRFWFVPTGVSIAVSDDGEAFETVLESTQVPREGAAYSPDFWSYPCARTARHVRVLLGASQHSGDKYAGCLELTEIEVLPP